MDKYVYDGYGTDARLSFTEQPTQMSEILKGVFHLSLISVGDQQAKLKEVHDTLVLDKKWLSQTQFKQVIHLCWSLPGPTTIQVLLTIVIFKMRSVFAGFFAFIVYNFLGWVGCTIFGLLSTSFLQGNESQFHIVLRLTLLGFNAAAAGIMVKSFVSLFDDNFRNISKLSLMLFATVTFCIFQTIGSIIFILLGGAIMSLYLEIEEPQPKMSTKSQDLFRKITLHSIIGKPSLILLYSIFLIMWIVFTFIPHSQYYYIFAFYFVGCFIVGPIQVVFAYFLGMLLPYGHIASTQIWFGIPLSFMLPGSILNIGIYYGTVIDGVKGALLAGICMYTPCFLSLLGILPQWKYYRNKVGVQRLMRGLVCLSVGLNLSIILLLLDHCMRIDLSTTICVFIVTAFINYVMRGHAYLTIIIGGILANMRLWGLNDYRFWERLDKDSYYQGYFANS